jgi:hypothetical protein
MALTLTKGTRTVTLRNPDFGDTDVIEARRIQRKNRGGDLVMYRDPQWPKTETFTFEFSFLKRLDLLLLIEFIKDFLGQEVTLTDYNGRVFQGIITTPSEQLAQAGLENFTAKFSFQVEL